MTGDYFKEMAVSGCVKGADIDEMRYELARLLAMNMYSLYEEKHRCFLRVEPREFLRVAWCHINSDQAQKAQAQKAQAQALEFLKKKCSEKGVDIHLVNDHIIFVYQGKPVYVREI